MGFSDADIGALTAMPPADVRRLRLQWGITPVYQHLEDELEANIEAMERYLLEQQFASVTDTVVITGSHPFELGVHTNFVKFHVLGRRG